jgi:inner membrane protein
MPTILTHPAAALLKSCFPRVPARAVPLGALLTILPDADVAAFALGIPYEHMLGHRGLTHSIAFALVTALLGTLALRVRPHAEPTFAFLLLCALSHPLLDALTNGGLGVAFFAPFSNHRYFSPWTPIQVSPIGAGFFSARGLVTVKSELLWVWLPLALLALSGKYLRDRKRKVRQQG